MDLSKAFFIGVDYKDRQHGPSWEQPLFAEIVLIDKTHSSADPLLYQVKDHSVLMDSSPPSFSSLSQDVFLFLGSVTLIDKKKKKIELNDKTTVHYNYLIIATGKPTIEGSSEQFNAGLQALFDAFRVNKKVPEVFTATELPQSSKIPQFFCCNSERILSFKEIEKIIHPYFAGEAMANSSLTSMQKRLYQVQM